ncbi:hypothetical protein B7C51_00265 [Paenibacillus larvae subsp. pulvifaciens]|uniref:HTH cro/C1-type domain-containing protein n=1 Tax=Paenibacillus larvae subsp. pulvifaciens TaxID=1477 RepID=A0A1V0UMR9_9BACL|nr:XRE family transcriptional regulator [Paenibacillus larvae]ARF66565.1 hypothetical protein B7C51_00265 [Paenibacillus larvae subsp. pulvifaciens]
MKLNKTVQYQRKVLADNIKKLLETKGKTQTDMARDLGIAETTVSSWVNCERYPRLDKIQLMADYFNVRRSELTEEKTDTCRELKIRNYPYFSTVSAGLPIEVEAISSFSTETIAVPDYIMGKWAGSNDVYIMRVNGDSMNKVIPHNSLIAVKKVDLYSLKNGDIVIFSYEQEYAVKRFYIDETNRRVIFRPDSTDRSFVDFTVPFEEVGKVRINGKVVVYMVEMNGIESDGF